jgi:hypothetical protein
MRARQQTQQAVLWALGVLVFLKVLLGGIEGWTEIAVLVAEVM